MPRTSLYREYRPDSFAGIIGQPVAVRIVQNSLRMNQVPAVWLMCGAWGSGKTTMARLLAKSVNCEDFDRRAAEPCNECAPCLAISKDKSPDYLELDAASHGKIDDIRKLRDAALHRPTSARRKVYLLDEVHMVSTEAFNSLLKILEEPPAHAMFLLATTDPDKLPKTILSRCRRINFRRISLKETERSVRFICESEGYEIADAAVSELARQANGSLRDAQSLLDAAYTLCRGRLITGKAVRQLVGAASPAFIRQLADALAEQDLTQALELLEDGFAWGYDALSLTKDLVSHLHMLLLISLGVMQPTQVWVGRASKFKTLQLRDALYTLAFDWEDVRRDPQAAKIMLEVKLSEIIGKD